jgi:hypothetical protein
MASSYWQNLYEDSLCAIWWQDFGDRSVKAMTNGTWLQGIEHGWVRRVPQADRPERSGRRFTLSDWLPTAILARGGRVSRDDERLYRDLQAARDAREAGR